MEPPHDHDHDHDLDPLTFGPDQLCFGCGPQNAVGLRMRFRREGDEVVTRFTPGLGYEGPPGILHGGLQATLVDELAAWTVVGLRARMGFTTALEVKLHRPVRIGTEIVGRGRITHEQSRRVTIAVTLEQLGSACVAGTVTYALPAVHAAERILGQRLPDAWKRFCR
ncbi:MAG: PaaI family thioesterase [Deltaproteobacteria bacterium]|nr:PaaI family thioesterase [Deltaproteobacteria bacterium]